MRALQKTAKEEVTPIQLAESTSTYAWERNGDICSGLRTLCPGEYETLRPLLVFIRARRFFRKNGIKCALLPSYSPKAETALFLAAKFSKVSCVMMNESHAGTEKAKGWKKQIKRMLVRRFDAALVGGKPHKEHFSAFGIPPDKIFTGYDAISNRTFSSGATEAKENAKNRRAELKLPPRYFLSLGRMVRKKNLQTLVSAYALFCQSTEAPVALCFVGSGETESALQSQAQSLGLRVHEGESLDEQTRLELGSGDVCFYGFRQISENPFFYGLAEAFILPSTKEEWGLVVNEAMASGLPVLVANGVGCAMDLVDHEVNGYLFNPMDAETLSGFLVDIATNTEKRAAMGKASERIIADWDVDNFARNAIKAVNAARAEA